MKEPKLTLIGAGPGDPDLITLKGIKALQTADAILYDALANDALLDYAPNAVKLNVGKRKGLHFFSQDEINDLIIQHAFDYGHVVRLKGGDPFVFGRGYEEIEFVGRFGIESSVIPGVSSSIGVAAEMKIPVTHRDLARSFWVVTGHTSDRQLPADLHLAAQSSATVVILMGTAKLPEIVSVFEKYNKSALPVAVIQNGTLPQQRYAIGQLKDIVEKVKVGQIANPAIIIIGEVVSLHPDYVLSYAESLSLAH